MTNSISDNAQTETMAHPLYLVVGTSRYDEPAQWVVCWRMTKSEAQSIVDLYNKEYKLYEKWANRNDRDADNMATMNRLTSMSDPFLYHIMKKDCYADIEYVVLTVTDDPELNNIDAIQSSELHAEFVKFGSKVACDVCMASPGQACHAVGSARIVETHNHRNDEGRLIVTEQALEAKRVSAKLKRKNNKLVKYKRSSK